MSNTAKGAATGAVQGAAAGAAVGGPVGAAIGAVIGTAWGAFAGGLGDKAEKKLKQAKQLQRLRERDAYKQRLLSTLRQGRIQRASSLAAAVAANAINSSGTEAALSSIGSQLANQVEYMSVDQGRAVKIEQLTSKGKKLAKRASTHQQALSATTAVLSLGGLAAGSSGAASAGTTRSITDGAQIEAFFKGASIAEEGFSFGELLSTAGDFVSEVGESISTGIGDFFIDVGGAVEQSLTATSDFFSETFNSTLNFFK